jgi:addiction module RelE/StbE family toxin
MTTSKRRLTLLWSGPALEDLREIREYISADNPAAAKKLAARLKERVLMLQKLPLAGRVVPELAGEGYREVLVPPYRIIYMVEERRVVILRVWHERRDLRRTSR